MKLYGPEEHVKFFSHCFPSHCAAGLASLHSKGRPDSHPPSWVKSAHVPLGNGKVRGTEMCCCNASVAVATEN